MTMALDTAITVRPAEAADADSIASLCGQLGYPSTSEDIQRRLAETAGDADAAVLVADSRRDGVVGWIHVRALRDLGQDVQLTVTSSAKRNVRGRLTLRVASAASRNAAASRTNVVRRRSR